MSMLFNHWLKGVDLATLIVISKKKKKVLNTEVLVAWGPGGGLGSLYWSAPDIGTMDTCIVSVSLIAIWYRV